MKCPMMFAANDVFCNGRECIDTACMWRVEAKDPNGTVIKTCAVSMLVVQPGLSVNMQMIDAPETGVK